MISRFYRIGCLLGLGLLLASTESGMACATCFGASDSAQAQGMNMGILSLLVVISFVLVSIAAFFGYLSWRSARLGTALGGSDVTDVEPVEVS